MFVFELYEKEMNQKNPEPKAIKPSHSFLKIVENYNYNLMHSLLLRKHLIAAYFKLQNQQ